MLVSHRYHFIYTKTLKTASTSVESYFERFCVEQGQWRPVHHCEPRESPGGIIGYRGPDPPGDCRWYNHMPASLIKERLGTEFWNSYFKFCVIRNPFEKTISAFEHFGRGHQMPAGAEGECFRAKYPGLRPEQLRFLHWLLRCGPPVDRDKYLIDGVCCLDDFIRYESLQADLGRICHHLGVPWQPDALARFKTDYRRSDSTPRELYSPPAVELVAAAFQYEIDRFGYKFPDSN